MKQRNPFSVVGGVREGAGEPPNPPEVQPNIPTEVLEEYFESIRKTNPHSIVSLVEEGVVGKVGFAVNSIKSCPSSDFVEIGAVTWASKYVDGYLKELGSE